MTTRKQRRIRMIILGVAVLIIASIAVGYGMRGSIEYYKSPTQIKEEGAPNSTFRIGGLVQAGSLVQSGEKVSFIVEDEANALTVEFQGILPDLFREEQGVIARGKMEGEIFVADEILAKHDEDYMPKEVVDMLKESGEYRPQ